MPEGLLHRAQTGDRAALDALLRELAPQIQRFSLRMCRHEADADDVAQDTLLAIADHLGQYAGRSSLSSWVFTLARTACARKRRGLKNKPALPFEAKVELESSDASPEQLAEERQRRATVQRALASLSAEHREVLALRDVEGLTAPEAAARLGLRVDAVKSRLHRARAALRDALREVLEANAPAPLTDCPDVVSAFSRMLEGELNELDCKQLEEHVSKCAACGATCAALQSALDVCRRA